MNGIENWIILKDNNYNFSKYWKKIKASEHYSWYKLSILISNHLKLINKDLSNHFISIELDNTNLILPLSIGDKIFGNLPSNIRISW